MSEPVVRVAGLHAYYGQAHILQDVSFEVRAEPVAIIGRNGMGKTTLCKALVGIRPPRVTGMVRLDGADVLGSPSYKIVGAGIGYVPQGRRLFPSLTTEEHLRMIGGPFPKRGRWTIEAVYELFPRLSERKRVSGAQLSGGEQQMLAIGRALLTNPRLMVMDEPSEGLAPAVVESLVEACKALVAEGVSLLLIEQNLGVATALAERQLVMVAGRIAHETTAARLLEDESAQQRFLGVEPLAGSAEG